MFGVCKAFATDVSISANILVSGLSCTEIFITASVALRRLFTFIPTTIGTGSTSPEAFAAADSITQPVYVLAALDWPLEVLGPFGTSDTRFATAASIRPH